MKDIKLDSNGDIVIEYGKIATVEDSELTAQTVKTVLGTNKGEWFDDEEEGINYSNILGKHTAKKVNSTTSISSNSDDGGLTESEELALARKLRARLEGDI